MYESVSIASGLMSSFDAEPHEGLDPHLFDGSRLRPEIRSELLGTIVQFLDSLYGGVESWLRVWLAGSGVSYRWGVGGPPFDLDVLLGVDWVAFRQANPGYSGLGDQELAAHTNEVMRTELWPHTADWHGNYEVTWYINPRSQDIRSINPYAAYDLVHDRWSVEPSKEPGRVRPDWHQHASLYARKAEEAVARYSKALTEVNSAANPAHATTARASLDLAVSQAATLYDIVHHGRRSAFTPVGGGYDDFANFLWQSGKKAGWVPALRAIAQYRDAAKESADRQDYGVELPDTDTLIRRAALRHR